MDFFCNEYKSIFESLLGICMHLEKHYPCILKFNSGKKGTGYKRYKVNNHHVMIMLDNQDMPHGIKLLLNPNGRFDMDYYLSLCREDIITHYMLNPGDETALDFLGQELPF